MPAEDCGYACVCLCLYMSTSIEIWCKVGKIGRDLRHLKYSNLNSSKMSAI